MTGEMLGIGIAAVAAVASWISAYTNRQTAERALRAFVWPVISHRLDDAGRQILLVRLKNDGAGTAFNVRWSVGSVTANERGKIVSDEGLTAEHISLVVRAMRPGETVPPAPGWLEQAFTPPPDDVWWLLVRWSDAAGVRWQRSDQGPARLEIEPQKLKTWRWQFWRPSRDW